MLKKIGNYILAKDRNAAVIAFLAAFLPIFYLPTGFIATIVTAFVTLQKGVKSGLYVLAWVALPTIALLILRHVGLFDILILRCILIFLFAALLKQYQSWGLLLEVTALIGIAVITLLHLFFPHLEQWWITHLMRYAKEASAVESGWKFAVTQTEVIHFIAPIASGLIGFIFAAGVLFELIVARWWQGVITETTPLQDELIRIHLGKIAALVGLALIFLMLLKIPIITDIFPLVLLPFFVAGLSLMHFFVRTKKRAILILILFYIILIFFPSIIVCMMAILGLLDCFISFRKRVKS